MSPLTAFALSLSMSVDAFAVSVGRGVIVNRAYLSEALRTGLIFGVAGALSPLIGWLAGKVAHDWVANYDHWLAFALLMAVGLQMVYGSIRHGKNRVLHRRPSVMVLIATTVGSGLDVMAVGLSLALVNISLQGILTVCLGVGLTTFVCATGGMMLGKVIGDRTGKIAEMAAGVVLCAVGAAILFEHLTA
ncbi:MAG: manganese efflux pump MntP family protein [Devosia sp.]